MATTLRRHGSGRAAELQAVLRRWQPGFPTPATGAAAKQKGCRPQSGPAGAPPRHEL